MAYAWDETLIEAGLVTPDQIQAARSHVSDKDAIPGYLAENGILPETKSP